MRIAIFYPYNIFASWYTLGGYSSCLKRMGYEVLDCALPGNLYNADPSLVSGVKYIPTVEELLSCDVIVLAFLEHISGWIESIYGQEEWKKIKAKVLVVARFDESFDRVDLNLRPKWKHLSSFAHEYSFPAAQDAETYKGSWLVYGADTQMFNKGCGEIGEDTYKQYGVGFVGSVYDKRQKYMLSLAPYLNVPFHVSQVFIKDLRGYLIKEQTELLAQNYRMLNVFFCLPPLSNLLVAKVFEVMACGTLMMFPRLEGNAAKNLEAFKDGKEIIYYEPGNYKDNADKIHYYLEHEDEAKKIADAGCAKVHKDYTLEKMFEKILVTHGVLA